MGPFASSDKDFNSLTNLELIEQEQPTQIVVVQLGVGQVTIQGDTGVVVLSEGSRFTTKARYAIASLIKLSSNSWLLSGNLSA